MSKHKHHSHDSKHAPSDTDPTSANGDCAEPAAQSTPPPAPEPEPTPATATENTSSPTKEQQLQEQLLRLRADFDNFRKRTLRDKAETYERAHQDLMLGLMPVLDHLQLALQAAATHNANDAFGAGLRLILDQIMTVFTQFGLRAFDVEGQPFDPARCDAVNYMPSDTVPEGVVLTQTRRGYLLKDRLLRPAQVVVSSGKQPPAAAPHPSPDDTPDSILRAED